MKFIGSIFYIYKNDIVRYNTIITHTCSNKINKLITLIRSKRITNIFILKPLSEYDKFFITRHNLEVVKLPYNPDNLKMEHRGYNCNLKYYNIWQDDVTRF